MAAATAARRLVLAPLARGPVRAARPMLARAVCRAPVAGSQRSFAASSLRADKWYSEDHEWIDISEDGKTGTIGISTYAAKALGDVVFVELPTTGLEVAGGDAMGAVESVKSASDIYSPLAGTVQAVNTELEEKPSIINQSPEDLGWIARLDLSDGEAAKARESLMDHEGYDAFTSE